MVNALIIVDPQNDFCEGGALGVPNSNFIFKYINQLKQKIKFDFVIVTQDWHPENHISFAKNHNLPPFSTIQVEGSSQMLWPVHCVQNSEGAQISDLLEIHNDDIFVKKGMIKQVEQYSGFGTEKFPTDLEETIRHLGITEVYVVGLALDYCVGNTALDAKKSGLKVTVIEECTKGVAPQTSQEMLKKFDQNDVSFKSLRQVLSDLTKNDEKMTI